MLLSFIANAAAPALILFGHATSHDATDAHVAHTPLVTETCTAPLADRDGTVTRTRLGGPNSCTPASRPTGSKGPVAGTPTGPVIGGPVTIWDPSAGTPGQVGQDNLTPVFSIAVVLNAASGVVTTGSATQLLWTTRNVDNCQASGGWTGRKNLEGVQETAPLTENTEFVLTCDGPNGTVSDTVTVGVEDGPAVPSVSISANPASVSSGGSSTLTWSSQDATSCIALGNWGGSVGLSGSQSTGPLSVDSTFRLACNGAGGTTIEETTVTVSSGPLPPVSFTKLTIAPDRAAWGKRFADVDGDGFLDILEAGGAQGNNVYWYRYPNWERFQIGSASGGDDIVGGDINGDGALDVVVNATPISWYENPAGSGGDVTGSWQRRSFTTYRSHDLQLADFNEDGKLDIAMRLAGTGQPSTRIWVQGDNTSWTELGLGNSSLGTGGLAVADIDADGKLDIVGDGYWLRQPTSSAQFMNGTAWTRYTIGSWPAGSSSDTADINKDGRLDVTLAASEVGVGQFAWFEAPEDPLNGTWTRHVIDTVEDVHRHHLVDFNQDGEVDIVFAEMHQSAGDRVGVYYNQGDGESWVLDILATHGSHNLDVGDVGNDGDIDFIGANWQLNAPADGDYFLWRNNKN
ncbi:MAG: FG-GAP repeat domain-containing protein [Gammaproteobacteria bacterium]